MPATKKSLPAPSARKTYSRKNANKGIASRARKRGGVVIRNPAGKPSANDPLGTRSGAKPPPQVINEQWHIDHCYIMRQLYHEDGGGDNGLYLVAAHILTHCVRNPEYGVMRLALVDCHEIIWSYVRHLLAKDYYTAAAILLWGPDLFTPEPRHTKQVWNALRKNNKNLIQGGGSLSKSYSGAVFFTLDWLEDPEWTCLKVLSVTREHAKRNIFANIKNLVQNTLVPIKNLTVLADSISVNDDEKQGIHLVTIPMGDEGKGRLRGFHPVPRIGPSHPKFGRLSRVRLALDEAEEIPGGVWEDINNILLTEADGTFQLKIFAATNPRNLHSRFGELAEPEAGWDSLDIEEDEEWISAHGWTVTRLDGKRCENVVEGRIVYEGFQTAEGYNNLLRLGTDHPEYLTMARGWFPRSTATAVIIPETLFDNSIGQIKFVGEAIPWGSVDLAFEGGDDVYFTTGRHGLAEGWIDRHGEQHMYKEVQRAIQVENQFKLMKLPTLEQAHAIRRLASSLGIKPQWLGVDRTGSGTGVHDSLRSLYGEAVFGVMFSWAATDTKILADDTETCSEMYYDIITEMAFAVRKFMETNVIKFNPAINWFTLRKQTTTRKFYQKGRGIVCIQSKKEFKKEHKGASPDQFDSMIIGVHVVRSAGGIQPLQVPTPRNRPQRQRSRSLVGVVDALEFMDVTS